MKTVQRFDRGQLKKPVRLDNGWMRVDGYINRSGILEYINQDGTTRREYRSPEEAFKADVLESFASVPLTNNHPAGGRLTAENTKQHQVGTVDRPVRDGDKARSSILITDAATVKDVEGGKVELSCGYLCDVVDSPGEVDGQRYDALQTNVRGNHVALVSEGRAGPAVRIRLDSSDAEVIASDSLQIGSGRGDQKMDKVTVSGIEIEVSAQAAQLIRKDQKDTAEVVAKYAADAKAAAANADKASARADAAEADAKKLKAELAEAPVKLAAQAAARVALEAAARKVLPDEKFDGKTDAEIKRAVVQAAHPSLKLDGKSEAYLEASFDLAVAHVDEQPTALEAARSGTAPVVQVDRAEDTDALIEQMKKRSREAHKVKA